MKIRYNVHFGELCEVIKLAKQGKIKHTVRTFFLSAINEAIRDIGASKHRHSSNNDKITSRLYSHKGNDCRDNPCRSSRHRLYQSYKLKSDNDKSKWQQLGWVHQVMKASQILSKVLLTLSDMYNLIMLLLRAFPLHW